MTLTRFYSLYQSMCLDFVYASEFQLLANDIKWDNQALSNHFHWGLQSEFAGENKPLGALC
mgnify:CR=1 FL=1